MKKVKSRIPIWRNFMIEWGQIMKVDNRYPLDARKPVYLGYDSIAERIEELVDKVKLQKYDAIIIILRGGSFPGMHLSFLTDTPVYFLKYDRDTRKVSWKGDKPIENKKVLIAEDFAGRGTTLTDCIDFLQVNYLVHTFVVCKDSLSRLKNPQYCCFELKDTNARYIIPWERHEYLFAQKLLRESQR